MPKGSAFGHNFVLTLTTLLILFSSNLYGFPQTPDSKKTPGTLCSSRDGDFAYYRYDEKIPYCLRKVSSSRKDKIFDLYNIPPKCRAHYTIDHFIPLALGGNNASLNLWPEHIVVKRTRPNLEFRLYRAMEKGEMSQSEAIKIIVKEKMKGIKESLRRRRHHNINSTEC